MERRPRTSEESIRTAEEALRQDMDTINRSEELLLYARGVRQRIEDRVRQLLNRDGHRQPGTRESRQRHSQG